MDKLSELAERYKTDKGPSLHNYTPIYNRYFENIRLKPLNILEIGVGGYKNPTSGGESLRMWSDYFPFSRITGIDIERKDIIINHRTKIYQGSQVDTQFLQKIIDERGPFDVIIDDGSHVSQHIIESFQFLFQKGLNPRGIYTVEDLNTAYEPDLIGNRESSVNYFKCFLDVVHTPQIKRKGIVIPEEFQDLYPLLESIHCYEELMFFIRKS